LTLENGTIGHPKTLVINYQPMSCKISEEQRSKLHHEGSLRSPQTLNIQSNLLTSNSGSFSSPENSSSEGISLILSSTIAFKFLEAGGTAI